MLGNFRLTAIGSAATAHVLAWAVAAFFFHDAVILGEYSWNIPALLALSTPVAASLFSLLCALGKCCRTLAWAMAWIVGGITALGIVTIGMFLFPVTALLFWTANELPRA